MSPGTSLFLRKIVKSVARNCKKCGKKRLRKLEFSHSPGKSINRVVSGRVRRGGLLSLPSLAFDTSKRSTTVKMRLQKVSTVGSSSARRTVIMIACLQPNQCSSRARGVFMAISLSFSDERPSEAAMLRFAAPAPPNTSGGLVCEELRTHKTVAGPIPSYTKA
jgi:hypothetical protein